jgi:hypothetical protein
LYVPSTTSQKVVEGIEMLSTTQDDEAEGLFGSSGKQKYVQTWLEFNCQEGHHYAKYSTNRIQDGKPVRTRKLEDGRGYLGTLGNAWAEGSSGVRARISAFVSHHYPNCHYQQTFGKDLEKFGLSDLTPTSLPAGWGRGSLGGDTRGESEVQHGDLDATERQEVQGDPYSVGRGRK